MSKRSVGRRTKLSAAVRARIVDAIRLGAFDHVAAQAAGIAPATFREWIARGEGRDPDRPSTPAYAAFAAEVRQARATARSEAEARVFRTRPFEWLRYGPGRDRPGEPGWTEPSKLVAAGVERGPAEPATRFPRELFDEWAKDPKKRAAVLELTEESILPVEVREGHAR